MAIQYTVVVCNVGHFLSHFLSFDMVVMYMVYGVLFCILSFRFEYGVDNNMCYCIDYFIYNIIV